jgi:hypothetical protein
VLHLELCHALSVFDAHDARNSLHARIEVRRVQHPLDGVQGRLWLILKVIFVEFRFFLQVFVVALLFLFFFLWWINLAHEKLKNLELFDQGLRTLHRAYLLDHSTFPRQETRAHKDLTLR